MKNIIVSILICLMALLFNQMNVHAQGLPYMNKKLNTEERVKDLLQRMSVEEKVGQMLKVTLQDLKEDEYGRITEESLEQLFSGMGIGCVDPPITDGRTNKPIDVKGIAKYSEAADQYLRKKTRWGIPAIQVDLGGIHGQLAYDATIFPQSLNQGSTWNPQLIHKMADLMAYEASLTGCDQFFAPLFDIAREPRYGRVEECFGEDPFLVAEIGKAFVNGLQGDPEITKNHIPKNKLIATAKHFVGYSVPTAGINIAPVEVGPRDFRSIHLYPFEKAIKESNVYSIMPAYNEVNGIPVHGNKELLRDILRDEYGFEGYVFADYGGVWMLQNKHKVTANKAETAILALKSGVDQEGHDYAYSQLIEIAKKDKAIEALIEEAAGNILRVKFKAGLFDNPYKAPKDISSLINTEKSRNLSREIAEESTVLLKNDNLLPLDLKSLRSIAVIGPNADQVQYGDYSITKDNSTGVTVLEGIKRITQNKLTIHYAKGCNITGLDKSGFAEAIKAAQKSDVVVLVIGGSSMSLAGTGWGESNEVKDFPTTGEGYDRTELDPPGVQSDLIREIYKTGKPVALVMIHGNPYSITWEKENLPAILEAWYPGSEGGNAIARILFGEVNPSGKLTVSIPQSVGHIPVFYNYKPSAKGHYKKPGTPENPGRDYVFSSPEPLFPFGFGLSYTQFEYSELKINKRTLTENDSIQLSVNVKNIGKRAGKEVVQVYINDRISSVTTPIKELKSFCKLNIAPGTTTTVQFSIPCKELGLWNNDMKYVVEPGEFDVMVGSSAEDIHLSDYIRIQF